MTQLPSIDLGWLGGGVGGLLRGDQGGYVGGGKQNAFRNFTEGAAKATDEKFASDSKKARSLRAYLGELDPTMKDKVQAMGLGDLEGHAMTLAEKKLAAKQKLNEDYMRQQIDSMKSAEAERTRDATATQEFGKAMQPPLSGRDYLGQFLDPAAPVNMNVQQANPLSAYFAAVAKSGGGAPDLRGLNSLAQFAPAGDGRGFPNVQVENIAGQSIFKGDDGRWQMGPGPVAAPRERQPVTPRGGPGGAKAAVTVSTGGTAGSPKIARSFATQEEADAWLGQEEQKAAQKANAPEVAKLTKELAAHEKEMAAGDTKDWRLRSREEQVKLIKSRLAELGAGEVEMFSPSGQRVMVPAARVAEAKAAGYQ